MQYPNITPVHSKTSKGKTMTPADLNQSAQDARNQTIQEMQQEIDEKLSTAAAESLETKELIINITVKDESQMSFLKKSLEKYLTDWIIKIEDNLHWKHDAQHEKILYHYYPVTFTQRHQTTGWFLGIQNFFRAHFYKRVSTFNCRHTLDDTPLF